MRRKDILIITAVFILIAFGTVFGIYYAINGGNIFSIVAEGIEEIAETKKEYHSNGWETAIVKEIKYDVPIPVGFKYVEGKKDTGIIIENINSAEKYMWIPNREVDDEVYEKVMVNSNLDTNTSEDIESMKKYNGFYVAIDERSNEEKFDEYLKENTKDFETYYKLKQLGYEAYKNAYKEATGEEFDLNSFKGVIDDNTKLDNVSKGLTVETHTVTKEELAMIIAMGVKDKVDFSKLKTLSLTTSKNEYTESAWGMLLDYRNRTANALSYIDDQNINKPKQEEKLANYYNQLLNFNITKIPDDCQKLAKIYSDIKHILLVNFGLNRDQIEEMKEILEDEIVEEKKVIEKDETNKEVTNEEIKDSDGKIVYIPKGFTYQSGTVATGYKIKNTDNLSFIWIPVDDVDSVKEKFIEKAKEAKLADSIISEYEKYEYEKDDELIKSIKTYGGFYISEAELGYDKNGNVINKFRSMYERGEGTGYNYVTNGDYYRNVNEANYYDENTGAGKKQREFKLTYDNAVKECQELFSDSETVVSHLTYGLEYDATMIYLLEKGAITVEQAFKDSTEIGKYKGTEEKQSIWEKESYLNGIYGLAGNLSEITQERDGENIILRGGSWYTTGTSMPIASKNTISENETDKGQDDAGNEITLGSVGIRTCLYIKTEYKENKDLQTKKEKAKEELKVYIQNNASLKLKDSDTNLFNNEYDETSKTYKTPALNNIVKYIEKRIDAETSSASFGKIIQYGKDEINNIIDNIAAMIEYPKDVEGYTYGETNDECWQIKMKAISEMEGLLWEEGVIKNAEGKETSYAEVRKIAEGEIEKIRNTYRNEKIKECIDDYPTAAGKDYTNTIKAKAKEEMNYTNDLANLTNIAVKYQEIIEIANKFDNTEPNSWDYYESWKNDYASIKKEYATKIASESKNKEEAEAIAKEGMEKVNVKSSEVIAQKKEEERKAEEAAKQKSNNGGKADDDKGKKQFVRTTVEPREGEIILFPGEKDTKHEGWFTRSLACRDIYRK